MGSPYSTAKHYEIRGQSVSGTNATRQFIYLGYDDADDVDAQIKANLNSGTAGEVPYVWAGLYVSLPCTLKEIGKRCWEVSATYGPRTGAEAGDGAGGGVLANQETAPTHGDGEPTTYLSSEISGSTGGGTEHITQSYETRDYRGYNYVIGPQYGQAIGVNSLTNEVAGCDVYTADPKFSINLEIPTFSAAFLKKLEAATGCTNKTAWFGYEPGEVLLTNVNYSSGGASGSWKIQFDFAVRRTPNEGALGRVYLVGSPTDPAAESIWLDGVKGWDHRWVEYKQTTQSVGGVNKTSTTPAYGFAERVYREYEFADLTLEKRRKKT